MQLPKQALGGYKVKTTDKYLKQLQNKIKIYNNEINSLQTVNAKQAKQLKYVHLSKETISQAIETAQQTSQKLILKTKQYVYQTKYKTTRDIENRKVNFKHKMNKIRQQDLQRHQKEQQAIDLASTDLSMLKKQTTQFRQRIKNMFEKQLRYLSQKKWKRIVNSRVGKKKEQEASQHLHQIMVFLPDGNSYHI